MEISKPVHLDLQEQNIPENDCCASNLRNVTSKIISWPNRLISNFHVELITALYSIGYLMPNSFVQNLVIDKLCTEKYSAETCAQLNTTVEREIQQNAAQYILVLNLVRQVPSIILSLFMGTWSDIYGRKFSITVPILGNILTSILYLLNYYCYQWPAECIIFAAIPSGLSGDFSGFMLGIFGYVRDIHPLQTVTMRISLLDGIDSFSAPLGPLIGGQLFSPFGYPAVFLTCILLHVLALFLANIKVNDKIHRSANWKIMLKDFFRYQAIVECFKTVSKKRDCNRRTHIVAILVTVFLAFFAISGFYEVIFMYTRLKIQWDVILISYYYLLYGGCQAIGMLFLLPLMIYCFKIPDILFGMIGCVGLIAFYVGTALASDTVEMYCVCTLLVVGSVMFVFLRSCISKWVSNQEIGKIMSLFAIIQALGKNVGQITATQVYLATISIFPGSFFVTDAIVVIIILCICSWIFIDAKQRERRHEIRQNQAQDVS